MAARSWDCRVPLGQEQKKPWRTAKRPSSPTWVRMRGMRWGRTKRWRKDCKHSGKSEAWPRGHACFSSPRIASFRYDNQQKGYERAAYLALAVTVTTVLSGWEPRGTDICNLKPQVERAMSRGIGARENARIKSELMEIRHESQGVICPEAKKSEAFVPCGHLRVKIILWLPGAKSKASCAMRPTCRRDVRSTMRVYLGSEAIAWDSWDGNWEKR